MPRIISTFSCLMMFCAGAFAQTLDVTVSQPGSLKNFIEEPAAVTSLVVSGSLDASDFYFIAREMPAVTSLNLAGATIQRYNGTAIEGRTQFDADIIPSGVFAGSAIARLTLPEAKGVAIGPGAFAMTKLQTLTVGANIAEIGDAAFSLCPDLTEVTIASPAVGAGAFADCPSLSKVTLSAPATLGNSAFARDKMLTDVVGSDQLTSIGAKAFVGCEALKTFAFGRSLHHVGERAFSHSGLAEADLSQCAASLNVGDWAFAEMPALTAADLSGASAMGDGVVFNNPLLTSFSAPATDSIATYSYALSGALAGDGLIPQGVRVVGAHALYGLSGVAEITVPASVEHIGDRAMAGMTGLSAVTTEATEVPTLGNDVWQGVDQSAVTLNVPDGYGPDYEAADQWKEFNIYDAAGIDDITSDGDAAGTLPQLKARFAGTELQVSISGDINIERLSLHDVNGILLISVEPYESLVTIDTSDLQGRIFIVSAALSDGRTASLKLAR